MPWARRHLWVGGVLLGVGCVLGYFLAPSVPWWPWDPTATQSLVWQAVGLLALAQMLGAVLILHPTARLGWFFVACAIACNMIADTIWEYPALVGVDELPYPSWADVFYLLSYVALAAGIVTLLKQLAPRRQPAATLDALLVTAAAALATWVLLVQPILQAADFGSGALTMLGTVVNVAYPLADLLVLAFAARLWFGVESGANWSLRLLMLGLLSTLIADSISTARTLAGTWADGTWVDAGWFAFYILIAAAAMHPSAAAEPVATTREQEASLARFVGLFFLAVAVPAALLLALGSWNNYADVAVVLLGGVLMFIVAMARMEGLLNQLRTTLLRERIIREANASLAASADREAIRTTAIAAVRKLIPGSEIWLVGPLPNPTSRYGAVILASSNGTAVGSMLDHETSNLLSEIAELSVVVDEPCPIHRALRRPDFEHLAATSLTENGRTPGYLVVASGEDFSTDSLTALRALADSVALANARFDVGRAQAERKSERRVQRMLQHASDVIAVLDPDLSVRYVTPAAERLLGSPTSLLLGNSWLDLVYPSDRDTAEALITRSQVDRPTHGEVRLVSGDGSHRYVDLVAAQVADQEEPGFVLTCHDVTVRRVLEQQLTHQAFHDALTGLANRALFTERLGVALEQVHTHQRSFAVLFIDLDDFKDVNDSLGHGAGDELLRQVTIRLLSVLREEDTAARLGGDEFALLLDDVEDESAAAKVAERLIRVMASTFDLNGAEVASSISVGIALPTPDQGSADAIMRNADLALYEAKNSGKNRFAVFVPVMHENAMDRLQLSADLRHGIDAGELVVHYQPIVDLQSDAVVGVEALVRWNHPHRGLLPPAQFIPLAEETGLVVPLGRTVLHEALQTVALWQRRLAGQHDMLISVNLSARQLQHDAIVDDVRQALTESDIEPSTVLLEITESVLLPGEGVTIERLRALSALGVRLFIDDFGTGYSSLSYLQQLPVDGIKLAREFVATLTTETTTEISPQRASATGLVSTIRSLAETLGLASIIAEGVETPQQRDALLALGYRLGQGYLMARPMPADDLVRHILSSDASMVS